MITRFALSCTVLAICRPVEAAELIGGANDTHDAVVRVLSSAGSCTGTYIDDGWVITAAHCVPSGEAGAGDVLVGFARDQPTVLASHRVIRDAALDLALVRVDVARLSPPVVPLPTLPPQLAVSADEVGEAVTLVGFGAQTAPLAVDERRSGTSTLAVVEADRLTVASTPDQARACFGDSGGPLLLRRNGVEYLAGVLSTGAADCSGVDHYVRIDAGSGAELISTIEVDGGCSTADGSTLFGTLPVFWMLCRRRRRISPLMETAARYQPRRLRPRS